MRDPERSAAAAAADLDERLRSALEPHPAAVERVVSGALAGQPPPPGSRRARRRLLGFAAGAALAAAALLAALRQPATLPTAPAPTPAPRGAIEIRNGGGMVTARSHSGRLWVVRAGPQHSAAGSIILIHIGGTR